MAPLVRTGGSRHTGLAAPPHRNIHYRYLQEYLDCYDACNPPLGAPYIEIVLTIGLEETSYEKSTIN